MSDSNDPQTNDDTFIMSGNVTSVAVEAIGSPSVIFWLKDTDGGITSSTARWTPRPCPGWPCSSCCATP